MKGQLARLEIHVLSRPLRPRLALEHRLQCEIRVVEREIDSISRMRQLLTNV